MYKFAMHLDQLIKITQSNKKLKHLELNFWHGIF
jgi:hypothetical protein